MLVICDNESTLGKAFIMDDAILAREIYIRTPAHCYGTIRPTFAFGPG